MPDDENILSVKNLRAYHTTKSGLLHAVDGISFSLQKGKALGLFGESGAGKSSVALAILGLFNDLSRYYASTSGDEENKRLWKLYDEARSAGKTFEELEEELPGVWGQVIFDGQDLVTLTDEEIRKIRGNEITYVPQGLGSALNPYSDIELQTAESLWAHDEDDVLWEKEVARRVLEVLDLVEIGDAEIRKALKPKEFSLGEDQRVLIAMALITQPKLMIADEPTTAVDVGVQRRILDAITLAREKLGLSMILISNNQGTIAQSVDTVAVMSAGRIMEFGDVVTVFKKPGHPFTRAFIMSNPPMELLRKIRMKGLRIKGIPGHPPDMVNPPSGCPFHPRCEYCTDICKEQVPEYREVEPGHWIMCHRYEELPELEF